MPVMIIPKEDGTDLRARIERSSSYHNLYDLYDIKNFLDLTIAEAFELATAYTDLRGIRYRVRKGTSGYHSFVSELIRVLNRGFAIQHLPLCAREMTAPEAKKRNADKKNSFLIVASPQKHSHSIGGGYKQIECYSGTDAEVLVRFETAECEVPKVMKNSPTTGLVITDYSFDNPVLHILDFVNAEEYIKHKLTMLAFDAIGKISNEAYDEYFNDIYVGEDSCEKMIHFFKQIISVSEKYIENMRKV